MATAMWARCGLLREHPEWTSVLITGADPMIMARRARRYIEPPSTPRERPGPLYRSGSAPSRWPTGRSGSSAIRTPTTPSCCSGEVHASGRNLAVMAQLLPSALARAAGASPRRLRRSGHRRLGPHPGPADGRSTTTQATMREYLATRSDWHYPCQLSSGTPVRRTTSRSRCPALLDLSAMPTRAFPPGPDRPRPRRCPPRRASVHRRGEPRWRDQGLRPAQ